jgi:CRP-like cAMP-binding protein
MTSDVLLQAPAAMLARRLKLYGTPPQGRPGEVRRHLPDTSGAFDGSNSPVLLLAGWGAEVAHLKDGRRQILDLALPGDVIFASPAQGEFVFLTKATTARIVLDEALGPSAHMLAALREAHRMAREARLATAVISLGRRSAYERTACLLLALYERHLEMGLADGAGFTLPLTQEMLADALGLSVVHINRTLQQMRSDGRLVLRASQATFPDRAGLASAVGYELRIVPSQRPTFVERRSA